MSYANRILTAMRYNREYSPVELAAMTHIDLREISRLLKMGVRGGVIECAQNDRFIKNRRYKSKQRELRL